MNKTASIIITVALVVSLGIVFMGGSKSNDSDLGSTQAQNIEMRDGVQYVTINVKGGYSPKISEAKAGVPTKLIVKTDGTYDCSASLVIQSLGYQKVLAQTGEEIIDVGTPKAGEPLQGVCGMGMYNFLINFS
jgi:plastocyanin domain-containing protein